MVPEMKIPGHITALYVFAVVNLMALFHVTLVDANIIIVDKFNITLEELPDLPAKFGPDFPADGLWVNQLNITIDIIDRDRPAGFGPAFTEDGVAGHVYYATKNDGCTSLPPPPKPHTDKWIAIIRRHGCDFDVKVLNAQKASYVAALIHNVGSNDLVPMGSGKYGNQVKIPSAFIGQDDAMYLRDKFDNKTEYTIIIDNRVPFNANLYLLPFAVVVGICFVLMVVFMIAKWIRDVRKKRRSRLSKEHLKKIPVKKFKKGDPYDVCAICLDEYEEGDKLRILPCAHAYHMKCIDPWLTKNKRTCPVCKRKVIPGDPDDSDSDSDSDEEPSAGENTPLLGASGGARNNNTFNNSGLPDAVRDDIQQVHGGSSNDSGSDGEGGVQSSGTFHNSLAEVHVPSLSRSPGSVGSYGATATLKLTNEMPKVGSINSAYDDDNGAGPSTAPQDDGEMYGAVGGLPAEFLQDDQVVVVNPKRRLVQPDDEDDDVRFVDNYYQEELKGVLNEGASAMEESEQQKSSSSKKDKDKKKEKKEKLPKKVKKKKRRRDEVA